MKDHVACASKKEGVLRQDVFAQSCKAHPILGNIVAIATVTCNTSFDNNTILAQCCCLVYGLRRIVPYIFLLKAFNLILSHLLQIYNLHFKSEDTNTQCVFVYCL